MLVIEQRMEGKLREELGQVLADMRVEFEGRFQRKRKRERPKNSFDGHAVLDDYLDDIFDDDEPR